MKRYCKGIDITDKDLIRTAVVDCLAGKKNRRDIRPLETLHRTGKAKPLAMLGRNIEQMAEADAVIFAPDWKQAAGCRVEHLAASEYEMRILYGKG